MDELVDSEDTHDITGSSDDDNSSPISDTSSSDAMEDRSSDSSSDIGVDDSDVIVETADSLESKLQDLINTQGIDNIYVEIPKVNLKEVIASNNEVHVEIEKFWKYEEEMWAQSSTGLSPEYEKTDEEFVSFKRDAQKEVNYLVKECECRKAASSYARASTSRTGVLSTEKLHSYRYNEDLFK